MKKLFYAWPLVMLVFAAPKAEAYKYIIYTDDVTSSTPNEVAKLMKTTYPFNQFDIEVEIVHLPPAELECKSSLGIQRLITCETDNIQKKTLALKGHQAMIVKNLPKYGGSSGVGGGVPVITSQSNPRTMLHEYLHTLGLCDEYEYSPEEAKIFCEGIKTKPNVAFIAPLAGYSDDSEARAVHGSAIPWFNDILPTIPITDNGSLGTGDVDFKKHSQVNDTNMEVIIGEPTGLYKGKVCNNFSPRKFAWHPGGRATIMENVEAGLGAPLENVVRNLMASKGVRLKMQQEEGESYREPMGENISTPVEAVSEPPAQVNNSGRNIFKSFFGWLKGVFESFSNVISR